MNNKSTLDSFIKIFKKAVPKNVCDFVTSQSYEYEKHSWYSNKNGSAEGHTDDFFRAVISGRQKLMLYQSIETCLEKIEITSTLTGRSPIQLNKYDSGSFMKSHVDHINSCFDGTRKGIPVLSVVGLLNDGFTGGEFYFFDDYEIGLEKGDILIFPSIFLYPHGVKHITTGTRYSFVQWAW